MSASIAQLIESRISANHFDTGRDVSEADISALVRLATLAPSAYNFQNWKFVAVRTAEARERLKAVCFGQQKVVDAPVTFIICGVLGAHRSLQRTLQPSVEAGIVSQAALENWVAMAAATHTDNPQLQRDEAFRSASLAAMTLMLAAEGMGLVTGAISGFDAAGIATAFGLAATEVPVILVTTGYAAPGNWAQKLRRPVEEVLDFA